MSPAPVPLSPDILIRIGTLPLFSSLPREGVARLLEAARIERVERDEMLFREGEPADRFYILLAGQVELFVQAGETRSSIIEVAQPGETFAESAIFDGGPFPMSARVLDEARLVMVPAAPFLRHLATDFKLLQIMMAGMSCRLRMLVRQIGELKLKSTSQRLGGFLLSLTEAETGGATVRLPYDKKLLASRLGMKPESLSRALMKLRDLGVKGENETMMLTDVGRLRQFCQEASPGER